MSSSFSFHSPFPFQARDVINLIGLKVDDRNSRGSEIVITCPIAGCSDKSGHMYINKNTNKICCQKCGWTGNTLTLYAYTQGLTNKEAYEDILIRLGLKEDGKLNREEILHKQKIARDLNEKSKASPIASVEDLNRTYSALLNLLPLSVRHMKDLLDRGFDEFYIYLKEYKSTPKDGEVTEIASKLLNQGVNLEGVPGFHKNRQGKWEFIKCPSGILIPVRDYKNRIQGLQIRIDEEKRKIRKNGKKEPKYKWVSSEGWEGYTQGTGAASFVHYACDYQWLGKEKGFHPVFNKILPLQGRYVCLTEGPLKADLYFQLVGNPCVAIPGVNAQKYIPKELKRFRSYGIRTVFDCLDMDYIKNEDVQKACNKLKTLIKQNNLKYQRFVWNDEYKGIDDYYAFKIKGIK